MFFKVLQRSTGQVGQSGDKTTISCVLQKIWSIWKYGNKKSHGKDQITRSPT